MDDWAGLVIWEPDTVAAALLKLTGGESAAVSQDEMAALSADIREGRLAVLYTGGRDGVWRARLVRPGDPDVPPAAFEPQPPPRRRWWRPC